MKLWRETSKSIRTTVDGTPYSDELFISGVDALTYLFADAHDIDPRIAAKISPYLR